MKVVLAIPPFNSSRSWGSSRRMKEGTLPALGVGYLAAELLARNHEVQLVDAAAMGLDPQSAADAILEYKPALVGISCLSVRARGAYALASALKSLAPDVTIVMGGPHVSATWRSILEQCEAADILVPGEGELTFADLVDRLETGESYDTIPGLVFRGPKGTRIETPTPETVYDLDSLRFPTRHMYDHRLYRTLPNQGRRSPAAMVITSRGCCWAKCTFCYNSREYAVPYRRRTPENVIEEIKYLVHDLGYREISFWDDNFCVGEKWVSRFCDLLDKENIDITWSAEAHVRTATKAMFERMAASGCYNLFFGIESGNPETLLLLNKGFTLDECREAISWAKNAGFEVRCSYMLGLPQETREMAENTIRFACELNTTYAHFVPYHIWPHTALEQFALEHGREVTWNEDLLSASYIPNTFNSLEEVQELVDSAFKRYYLRPRYIMAALLALRHPSQIRRAVTGFRFWLRFISERRKMNAG